MIKRRGPTPFHIRITPAAAVKMIRIAQRALPNETGGVLIGQRTEADAVVALTVGPGPKALHGPTSFTRDGDYAQLHVNRHRKRSNGVFDYIAEWHSHPLPYAPSSKDTASMRAISRDPNYRSPSPLLVLCVLSGSGKWELQGYIFRSRRLYAVHIEVRDELGPSVSSPS